MTYRIVAKHNGVVVDTSRTGNARTAASVAQALIDEGNEVTVYDCEQPVNGARFVAEVTRTEETMREYRRIYHN